MDNNVEVYVRVGCVRCRFWTSRPAFDIGCIFGFLFSAGALLSAYIPGGPQRSEVGASRRL